jgi:16S rRNA (uracil1498-N3)-methyltransferase
MLRALIQKQEGDRAILSPAEVHHLVRVRRARKGLRFEGLNKDGRVYLCILAEDETGWYGAVEQELTGDRESALRISLAPALISKDKFEWILQKSVELGVHEILPMVTQRTEIRLDEKRSEKKLVRWSRILEEAVKQCGRSRVPRLHAPASMEQVLESRRVVYKIYFDGRAEKGLKDILVSEASLGECLVLVGPEGGWDDRDRQILEQFDVVPAGIGPRILRAETAALSVLSILQYQLGDMG